MRDSLPLLRDRATPTPIAPQLVTATAADLDRLVELDRLCFGQLWSRDAYTRELGSPNSDILLLHPAGESEILAYGCTWAIVDEAHITILGVHPQQRRRGFGRMVLYGLLAIAQGRGLTCATLEVSTHNHAAIALYEQFGFRHAGCRPSYYANGDDAAILWKSGLQHPHFRHELDAVMVRHHVSVDFSLSLS